jgi:UDP-N-acetylglucosamine 2-epimerase
VTLLPPQSYLATLRLVSAAWLILTDSGGLQEEAPSFRRPVLVLRDRTERTEGVACGVARLVGTRRSAIVAAVTAFLDSSSDGGGAVSCADANGDGDAAERIYASLVAYVRSRASGMPAENLATA